MADETLRKAAIALNTGGAQSWAHLRVTVGKYPVLLDPAGRCLPHGDDRQAAA
jgi:hypothetical protein